MKREASPPLGGPLPRRDIVAICAYLNRGRRPKATDHWAMSQDEHLQKLTDAARMQ